MVGRHAPSNPSQITLNPYLTYNNGLPTTHLGGKAKGSGQGVRTLHLVTPTHVPSPLSHHITHDIYVML